MHVKSVRKIPTSANCTCLGVPVVSEVEDVAGVRGHGVDVSGDDLVEVLELLQTDPQGLAQAERVDLALLLHVNVLVDPVVDLSGLHRRWFFSILKWCLHPS